MIKRKLLQRSLLGIPLGITMGLMILIIISLVSGHGEFVAVVPEMAAEFNTELGAVTFNMMLNAILGASFAGASVIWEIEEWSIAKQTITHFIISSGTMIPVAWFGHWVERSMTGLIIYFGIFVVIFAFIWITMYFVLKNRINKINQKLAN